MALKTIIVAHNDALTAAKSEVDVEKAIMLYLKNMLDDGYIMIPLHIIISLIIMLIKNN